MDQDKGKLYLLPNFIGNTPPALNFPLYNAEIMKELKFFYVENPKPARVLLKTMVPGINLDEVEFIVHDKHSKNRWDNIKEVFTCLSSGHDVGVISDAGCPGIADPGSEIVKMAHRENVQVMPLIGPSSIFLTLMASGLNGQHFSFAGYLPKEPKERTTSIRNMSKTIGQNGQSFIFIETPYRAETLMQELLQAADPGLHVCIGVDVFSTLQTIITDKVSGWKARKDRPKLKDRQVVFVLGA